MMGTVRILWGITVGVVHAVKNGIRPWRKVGAALARPCENVKKLFPEFTHNEHLMRRIPM